MAVQTLNWSFAPGSTPDANSCGIEFAAADVMYPAIAGFTELELETNAGCIARKVHDFLISHGWSKVANTHVSYGGAVGKYGYSAPNLLDSVGASSYKYILLDYATSSARLIINCYGLLEANGNVPTNAISMLGTHVQVLPTMDGNRAVTTAGKIWLSCTARHIVFMNWNGTLFGNPTATWGDYGPVGVFECTRANNLDLASQGYGKFCCVATGQLNYSAAVQGAVGFTSTRAGTGNSAVGALVTCYGAGGTGLGGSSYLPAFMPSFNNSLALKPVASNGTVVRYIENLYSETLGTIMNCIFVTKGYGAIVGDEIILKVSADPNYGNEKFYDPINGTPTAYWLVGGLGGRIAVPK